MFGGVLVFDGKTVEEFLLESRTLVTRCVRVGHPPLVVRGRRGWILLIRAGPLQNLMPELSREVVEGVNEFEPKWNCFLRSQIAALACKCFQLLARGC